MVVYVQKWNDNVRDSGVFCATATVLLSTISFICLYILRYTYGYMYIYMLMYLFCLIEMPKGAKRTERFYKTGNRYTYP